jgi:hypothetical protein
VAGGGSLSFFHRAGAYAEYGICRAKTDEACQQWNYAYPAPHADCSGGSQSDQHQTGNDAQCAVYRMFVDFHFDLLKEFVFRIFILGGFHLFVCDKNHTGKFHKHHRKKRC